MTTFLFLTSKSPYKGACGIAPPGGCVMPPGLILAWFAGTLTFHLRTEENLTLTSFAARQKGKTRPSPTSGRKG